MCRLHLGETFVEVTEEYATEYCEKKQEVGETSRALLAARSQYD